MAEFHNPSQHNKYKAILVGKPERERLLGRPRHRCEDINTFAYYFLLHTVRTGSGAYPASYQMGTGGNFPGGYGA
jgi:hypothetical protein